MHDPATLEPIKGIEGLPRASGWTLENLSKRKTEQARQSDGERRSRWLKTDKAMEEAEYTTRKGVGGGRKIQTMRGKGLDR